MLTADRVAEPFDPRELRRVLGRFVTGVTILTALDEEGRPRGLTANSFTSVSLDPPLVLVCVDERTASHSVFQQTSGFVVNILADSQADLANRFASSRLDKFQDVALVENHRGAPALAGCAAWLSCDVHSRFSAGDHLVVIGRVREFESAVVSPLAFAQGAYVSLLPDRIEAAGGREGQVVVAWLVECDGHILLAEDAGGALDLPMVPWSGSHLDEDGLLTTFAELFDIPGDVQSLFSVFDDHERGVLTLIYRAQALRRVDRQGLRAFPADALPLERIARPHVRDTLVRYQGERVVDRFGIYAGSLESGRVAEIHPPADPDRASAA